MDKPSFGTSKVSPTRFNLRTFQRDLDMAHQRLLRATVEHLDWKACVTKYDHTETCIYLDPPYWQTKDYGVTFGWGEYLHMAEWAKTAKSKVVISINDLPEIRTLFEGFRIKTVDINYINGAKTKAARELIICNR